MADQKLSPIQKSSPFHNHYNTLELSPTCTTEEILAACEAMLNDISLEETDKDGLLGNQKGIKRDQILQAQEILSNPTTRAEYDEGLYTISTPGRFRTRQRRPAFSNTFPAGTRDGSGQQVTGRKRSLTVVSIPAAKREPGDILASGGLGDLAEGLNHTGNEGRALIHTGDEGNALIHTPDEAINSHF